MLMEQRLRSGTARQFQQEHVFQKHRTKLHYSATPLPAPFPPLAPKQAQGAAARLLAMSGQAEGSLGASDGKLPSRTVQNIAL